MKRIKVLGTNAIITGSKLNKLHELGAPERERQFRIICGCTSLADANRQCEEAGLDNRTFQRNFSVETGNPNELDVARNGGVFISLPGGLFVTAKELEDVDMIINKPKCEFVWLYARNNSLPITVSSIKVAMMAINTQIGLCNEYPDYNTMTGCRIISPSVADEPTDLLFPSSIPAILMRHDDDVLPSIMQDMSDMIAIENAIKHYAKTFPSDTESIIVGNRTIARICGEANPDGTLYIATYHKNADNMSVYGNLTEIPIRNYMNDYRTQIYGMCKYFAGIYSRDIHAQHW